MKDDTTIFGAKSDNLDRLLRFALEPPEEENQAAQTASLDTLTEKPGGRIDKYKLLRILGEGGMGIVYLAEQEEPVKRQVALKVIKPGMDSKRVIARFEAEKQALALMQHPNIAGVYDAGLTLTGRPYFVMEYVKGTPITDYCDHNKLTINKRLKLFQQVCQAVQHAHQKGIIHRDIKPSNILVSTQDGQVVPKIIDFGVAKATGKPLTEHTLATEDTQMLGTPEYMSPEQADMATEDIDTRSDVYSLGVLLYVLLAGVLPFDPEKLRDSGIENFRKTIRQTDPKTPSTRLVKLGEEATVIAQNRGTEIGTLTRHLHKELEWIPLKAMRKERSERYRSASELADDIENYLNGVPLIAGPPVTIYRLKKFVRRNRVLVGGIVAVLIVLIAGVVGIVIFAIKAEQRRAEADFALAEAQLVTDFLEKDVLGFAKDVIGRDAMAMDLLDNATKKLDEGRFKKHPLTEASVRLSVGNLIKELGYPEKAIPHLERVRDIRTEQYGKPGHLVLNYLALAYLHSGELKKAETVFHQIIQEKDRNHRMSGADLYTWVKQQLAIIYNIQARYEESERVYFETISLQFPKGKPIGPGSKVELMVVLADTFRAQGRYEEAEQMLTKSMDIDKSDRKIPHQILARLYLDQGYYQEAEDVFREVIERHQRDLPGEGIHRYTLPILSGLAVVYTRQGGLAEAESLFREVREIQIEKLGEEHWETLKTLNDFGVLRREQQRYEESESMLHQALEGRQRKLGVDHPDCFESMHELAVLYKKQVDYEKAEPLLKKAVEGRRLKLGDKHPHTIESMNNLIDLYEAWNKPEKAEEWRLKLSQTGSIGK
ncbi:MAG: tetratricopeptide repeat protein [Planctomycetota bacterium]